MQGGPGAIGWVSPTTAPFDASLGVRGPLPRPLTCNAATSGVMAPIPRVYGVWYAVLPAPGSLLLPPLHQYTRAEDDTTVRAWLAARALVRAWRLHRGAGKEAHT